MSMDNWWNDTNWGTPKYLEKILSECHFLTIHPTWTTTETNLGLCGEMPATNHMNYGMAS
jgi:hypothetical protein